VGSLSGLAFVAAGTWVVRFVPQRAHLQRGDVANGVHGPRVRFVAGKRRIIFFLFIKVITYINKINKNATK
jgi:hypothetical protein